MGQVGCKSQCEAYGSRGVFTVHGSGGLQILQMFKLLEMGPTAQCITYPDFSIWAELELVS